MAHRKNYEIINRPSHKQHPHQGALGKGIDNATERASKSARISESEITNELEELPEQELEKVVKPEEPYSVAEMTDIKEAIDAGYKRFTERTENIHGQACNRSHLKVGILQNRVIKKELEDWRKRNNKQNWK